MYIYSIYNICVYIQLSLILMGNMGDLFQDIPWMLKSTDAQVPDSKWYSICM